MTEERRCPYCETPLPEGVCGTARPEEALCCEGASLVRVKELAAEILVASGFRLNVENRLRLREIGEL